MPMILIVLLGFFVLLLCGIAIYNRLVASKNQLDAVETAIAGARQHHNNAVMQLNTMVESFPSNLVAGPFNFAKAVFFEIPEADRKPVRVDLR